MVRSVNTVVTTPVRIAVRYSFMMLAILWAVVVVVILVRYHVPESPGVRSVTTNGHTYYGHPPALTLLERDPVSFVVITIVVCAGNLVGAHDLALRRARRTSSLGYGAIVAGAVMIFVSLLGLLFGLATVGVDGALLIVSGLPIRFRKSDGGLT